MTNSINLVTVLLVGAGGCIGSIARYLAVVSIDKNLSTFFPYGTLAVNVAGSAILGVVLAWVGTKTDTRQDEWKFFLGTGFCGGFTTFSAFAFESLTLFEQKFPGVALLYIALSVISGLTAVWAGFALGKTIF